MAEIAWDGTTGVEIVWVENEGRMKRFQKPVRASVPQTLTYTFKNADGTPLDLTDFVQFLLQVKLIGQDFEQIAFPLTHVVDSPTQGKVQSSYIFNIPGTWTAQFVADRVFGDPITFLVVPNVENLTTDELPAY